MYSFGDKVHHLIWTHKKQWKLITLNWFKWNVDQEMLFNGSNVKTQWMAFVKPPLKCKKISKRSNDKYIKLKK
jgi:hypothetical protein